MKNMYIIDSYISIAPFNIELASRSFTGSWLMMPLSLDGLNIMLCIGNVLLFFIKIKPLEYYCISFGLVQPMVSSSAVPSLYVFKKNPDCKSYIRREFYKHRSHRQLTLRLFILVANEQRRTMQVHSTYIYVMLLLYFIAEVP